MHKFYMAIFQVNYAPEKKMLQVTSRIFIDDLNQALEKKYGKKTNIGHEKEDVEDIAILKKYFAENLVFKVNGQTKTVLFLSKEQEGDLLICYGRVADVAKFNSVEITNTVLTHWNSDQQNILHFNAFGDKKTVLFTSSKKTEVLKF
ncbi:hypothetical protein GENT11_01270 [Flavobacterium ammonificans]|uniref:Uncharacterized protein n=2 Tax=Flavobacterium ammonificans TaxID=1751056 RepID=A0ABM7UWW7_9FLAO|nr:hypothetical protein GENT11_01270 [Flavobacterium ammonificans]